MKFKYIGIIILFFLVLVWWFDIDFDSFKFKRNTQTHSQVEETPPEQVPTAHNKNLPLQTTGDKLSSQQIIGTPTSPTLETQISDSEINSAFGRTLDELKSCFKIQIEGKSGGPLYIEPTYENLIDSVKLEFQEPVVRNEDWSKTYLKMPDGENRIVQVKMDFSSDRIVQRLSYFKVNPDGSESEIELTADQKVNPNESLIASLESTGEPLSKEKNDTTHFQNGEEIIVTYKNDRIVEFTINANNIVFSCKNILLGKASCICK